MAGWWRAMAAAVALAGAGPAEAQLFDSHVHLANGEATLAAYRAQLARDGLSVEGLGAMWFGGPNQVPAGQIAATRAGNDALIALAARHRDVLPVGTVHPYDGAAAIAELERITARGVRVLKIHPHTQRFDAADPRVLTLVQRAGALGVVVLMDNAGIVPADCEKLFNLALAAPRTRFVFAHLGGMRCRVWNILKAARTAEGLFGDNIFFDLSATAAIVAGSPIEAEFVWTVRNVGVDHVLLGSDYPQYSLAANLRALERMPFTDAEKAAIRVGNARRLFGLPGRR
jgi:uncharacterized protein